MRYQDQQYDDSHPDVAKSDPVPVPPPTRDEPVDEVPDQDRREDTTYDSRTDDDRVAEEALADRGTFDDPVTVDERAEAERSEVGGFDGTDDADAVTGTRDDSGFGRTDGDRDVATAGPVGAEAEPNLDRTDAMPRAGLGPDVDRDLDSDRDLDRTEATPEADLDRTEATREADLDRTEAPGDADLDRSDYDRDHVAEPAPQPTAFGAATVGGAAAAAAMAGQGRAEPHDVRDEDTARRGDGTADDQLANVDTTPADRYADATQPAGDRDLDADDRTLDTEPGPERLDAVPPVTARTDVGTPASGTDTAFDGQPIDGQPLGEVAPAGQLMPGDVPAEPVAALLPAETGQDFQDRWREVQLRFVDDPRAAAGDAQRLVEEAVESMARALAEQKDKLGGWDSGDAGDTERLRVAVRRYRDFLDRLLGL